MYCKLVRERAKRRQLTGERVCHGMGKPSISMGFENRTTCCMCPPPLSPPPRHPRSSSLESTRPPLDTRADSFPGERWSQTVPNVFPDIGEKYGPHAAKREREREEDTYSRRRKKRSAERKREECFEKYKRRFRRCSRVTIDADRGVDAPVLTLRS